MKWSSRSARVTVDFIDRSICEDDIFGTRIGHMLLHLVPNLSPIEMGQFTNQSAVG